MTWLVLALEVPDMKSPASIARIRIPATIRKRIRELSLSPAGDHHETGHPAVDVAHLLVFADGIEVC
ncbi:MAG TPA: hypothetical protein VF148_04525 [Acidimicrobiia bacterium]